MSHLKRDKVVKNFLRNSLTIKEKNTFFINKMNVINPYMPRNISKFDFCDIEMCWS